MILWKSLLLDFTLSDRTPIHIRDCPSTQRIDDRIQQPLCTGFATKTRRQPVEFYVLYLALIKVFNPLGDKPQSGLDF